MKVKVRAVVLKDGKLLVSRERRQGVEHVLLPGGRVQNGESITEALVREVTEETGLDVVPERLLYVAEVVGRHGVHDLNLVWLATPSDPQPAIDDHVLIALDSPLARSVMPPIVEQIAADAADGWASVPRWLGNVRRPSRSATAGPSGSSP
jgi:ADP-ribose pyrophosphatase YjhB (NUDIX family)